ncbi:retention module-containing protein, partial [Massilia sp. TSP1-1-2]|uniref:retention module-containing protein n=1 Tax=Massilia sp. TSP1-1-2 TaxID=2804649 RepID=UPI003CF4C5C8
MAITGNLIGKVTLLAGNATARSPDGAVRALHLGDPVYEGDVIVTAQGGKVEIAFDSGRNYLIGANETVTLDGQVFAPGETETRDAALMPANGELGDVTQALLTGNGSLDGLIEEPAAGLAAGGGDDNGSSFVELLRISESTTPLESATTSAADATRPEFLALGAATESAPAGTISVELPGTIAPGSGALAVPITGSTSAAAGSSVTLLVQDSDPATPDVRVTAIVNADGTFGASADLSSMGRGSVTVTATAADANGNLVSASSSAVKLNAQPGAAADAIGALEDTPLTIAQATLLGNDADADGDALTITSVQGALNGSVALVGGGVVFTPAANYNGPASFTYTVSDGQGGSATATVNLNVGAVNDPAVITPGSVTLTETNAPLSAAGTLAITDIDSPATFVPATLAGAYGSLAINATGAWSYTASGAHNEFAAGTTYSDTFTVSASDGATGTVTVNIVGTNDAAIITAAAANLTESDVVLTASGSMAISDADSAATFVPGTVPGTYGSLAIDAAGNWNYTASSAHNEFAFGATYSDSFTVTSADGTASTVTINIAGTNDAAVIGNASVSLTENGALLTSAGTLSIADVDSPAVFVPATIAGTYGSIALQSDGQWTYTASSAHPEFAAGATYSDVFAVTSADGTTGTITVNISGANNAAVISGASASLTETDAVLTTSGTLAISDVDSPATFVPGTLQGSHGSITLQADGQWVYTASSAHDGFAGGATYSDSFTVTSTDGTTAAISISIQGTNDAAVISAGTATLTENGAVLTTGGVLGIADVDSPASFAPATIAGTYGSVTLQASGQWSYSANSAHPEFAAGATYTDTFAVASSDGTASTITVSILGTNDAAVIGAATVGLEETNAILTSSGALSITDVDSQATFVTGTFTGTYGSLALQASGQWVYTASSAHNEFAGGAVYSDVFTVASTDGTTSTVTVNILGTNDAAVISTASVTLIESSSVLTTSGVLTMSDVDNAVLFVAATLPGTYGSLSIAENGAWTYTASSIHDEFAGGTTYTDTFTVNSADGTASTITVNILGSNGNAVISTASVDLFETNEPITTSGVLTISDADSPASFTAETIIGNYGSVNIAADGAWTFTANSAHDSFVGGATYTDVFVVTSEDGTPSTITVNIAGTNDAAVIGAAVVNLEESNLALTASGALSITDADNPATFAPGTVTGTYGSIALQENGQWTYTANSPHNEFLDGTTYTDIFNVKSSDGTSATITVNILGTNDAAVLSTAVVPLTESDVVLTASGTLTVTDIDSAASYVEGTFTGTHGTVVLQTNGQWTYEANSAHNEFVDGTTYADVFNVKSTDGTVTTITVNILGTNDAAVLSTAVVPLTESDALLTASGTLTVTDIDSSASYVGGTFTGTHGTVVLQTNGQWTYEANSAHNEFVDGTTYTDVFNVKSTDGTATTITVNILGTNDAAVLSTAVIPLTESDVILTASGTLAVTDIDSSASYVGGTFTGTHGTVVLQTTGQWTYEANSAHNEFVDGTTYTDVFNVKSTDGTVTTITVNILGTNDAAVLSTAVIPLTESDVVLTASGTLAVTDNDSSASYVGGTFTGTHGTVVLQANGQWTYEANSAHNEFVDGTTYTDVFNVKSADGTATTITVNILGTNDAAVLSTAVVPLNESDVILTASGTLSVTDIDSSASYVGGTFTGTHGSVVLQTNGQWTYEANSVHNEFVDGTTYTDVFNVKSTDGTATTITVNILGTNDAAVLSAATVPLTESDVILTASGMLTVTDIDSSASYVGGTFSGTHGTVVLQTNGQWTYEANSAHNEFVDGTTYTDIFNVKSADGTATTITVNILGTNDAAVLSTAVVPLTESDVILTASGTLTVTDIDNAASYVGGTFTGTHGTVVLQTNGQWTYEANSPHNEFVDGTTYTDVFNVKSTDGTATTITVNILGTNDAAVLSAATVPLTESDVILTASGTLTVTDNDSSESYVGGTFTGTHGTVVLQTNGQWTYEANSAHNEFIDGTTYTDVFNVKSTDGTATTITVNILGTNDAAVLSTAVVPLTESDVILTASGMLTVTDIDSSASYVGGTFTGTHGTVVLQTNGQWTYEANSVHNEFVDGTIYTDVFNVKSADGSATTITVNILGTNDAAVLSTAVVPLTESDAILTASGTLTVTDIDSSASYVGGTFTGTHGTVVLQTNGQWTYEANSAHNEFVDGTTYTDVFNVKSTDGTTTTITVNILGTNDAAVLSAATVPLTESDVILTASGTLAVTDIDNAASYVGGTFTGTHGTVVLQTNGQWTYEANSIHNEFVDGTTYTDVFNVKSADGTATTITVNILGTNDAAVLSTAVVPLTESDVILTASGTLSVTDIDSSASYVGGTFTGTHGTVVLQTNGQWTYEANSVHNEFVDGTTYTDVFNVKSADGSATTITVNILGTNDAAVLSTAVVPLTESDAILTASGTLTVTDIDSAASYVGGTFTGTHGTVVLQTNGQWTYEANSAHNEFVDGTTYTDVF